MSDVKDPSSRTKTKTYVSIVMIVIGIFLILYSIVLYVDIYNSQYIPISATVVDADCRRYVINRRRDTYNCILTIRYTYMNKIFINSIRLSGGSNYYVGSDLLIYIDRNDPITVRIPSIPYNVAAISATISGLVFIVIAIGIRYI
jgi:hypothetical protein